MRPLTYATLCSGVECMGAAVADLPVRPVFFSEIEPFPCAVLRHRYPNVPNLGDMSEISVSPDGKEVTNGTDRVLLGSRLDILAGGTPCQDVSTAGLRRGMSDGSGTRSSLAFEFVRLVRELRPRYIIWENVAGVLSDPSFPGFLSALAERGYGLAYRVLDAQWTRCADIHHPDGGVVRLGRAVPQRRRRVWVVGCSGGDVRRASEVLFEREGLAGDRPPRRVAGQGAARPSAAGDGVAARVVGAAAIAGNVVGRSDGNVGNGVGAKDEAAFENHAAGARVSVADVAPTMGASRNANASNNNSLVVAECVVATNSNGGDVMPTLSACKYKGVNSQDDKGGGYVLERRVPSVVYGMNPQGGQTLPFHEECGETLACCHDGGVCLSFNTKQRSMDVGDNVSATLVSTMYTEPEAFCIDGSSFASLRFVVRRLTPTECERLQGLPDGWTLPAFAPGEITDALVEEFRRIHDTFNTIMAAYGGRPAPRPKAATWVRRWLDRISDPATCPDAPRLKACGNGWATNQPRWIVLRLLFFEGIDPWSGDGTDETSRQKGNRK